MLPLRVLAGENLNLYCYADKRRSGTAEGITVHKLIQQKQQVKHFQNNRGRHIGCSDRKVILFI